MKIETTLGEQIRNLNAELKSAANELAAAIRPMLDVFELETGALVTNITISRESVTKDPRKILNVVVKVNTEDIWD